MLLASLVLSVVTSWKQDVFKLSSDVWLTGCSCVCCLVADTVSRRPEKVTQPYLSVLEIMASDCRFRSQCIPVADESQLFCRLCTSFHSSTFSLSIHRPEDGSRSFYHVMLIAKLEINKSILIFLSTCHILINIMKELY